MAVSNQAIVARGIGETAPILPKWSLMKLCQQPHDSTALVLTKQRLLLGKPVEEGGGGGGYGVAVNHTVPTNKHPSLFSNSRDIEEAWGFLKRPPYAGMTTRRENIATETQL